MYRGSAGAQHEQVGRRHRRRARYESGSEARALQGHLGAGLVRIPAPVRVQDGMARRLSGRSACGLHTSDELVLWPRIEGKPQDPGAVCLRALRVFEQCRSRRRDQCFRARTALVCLWRDGAVRPPVEAGTHRSDSGHSGLSAVEIPVVHGGEDVKTLRVATAVAVSGRKT
ncbi:DNA primase [Caballeronia sordidicola]|uniref:DNA primase n=1 Tax=Caballeronia sordidicola TaxID=196367 RepID=A0A226X832_CABSO|nr:DNA primase [Caballeronia sordidicola]